jgi:hypothetical protein
MDIADDVEPDEIAMKCTVSRHEVGWWGWRLGGYDHSPGLLHGDIVGGISG